MFAYYLRLSAHSALRTPGISALTVLTIGLGIGVFMAALTVFYLMAANPIPHKSDALYAVRLDNWNPNKPIFADRPEQPPWEIGYRDAQALRASPIAPRRAAMHKVSLVIEPERDGLRPFETEARLTDGDFFAMFDVPFLYGSAWDRAADDAGSFQVVLARSANDRLFGGANSVGRTLLINGRTFTVTGVIDTWNPVPKFYDLNSGVFDTAEEFFVPFGVARELQLTSSGNNNCWKAEAFDSYEGWLASECVWIQFWAELDTPGQVERYRAFLDDYVNEQKRLGRFGRPLNNRLEDVATWLDTRQVVRNDNKVLVVLAFLFLGVCLFNTVGLLLTKFDCKAPQVGLRRALGASRRAVFLQQLTEVGGIGAVGGLVGLGMSWLALRGVRATFHDFGGLTHLDWALVATAIACAVTVTVLAGLYPAWRVCRLPPATFLRLQ